MLPRIPKKMCGHTITLLIPNGKRDAYRRQTTTQQVIKHALVQPQTIYTGSNNDRTITANAVVFFLAEFYEPLAELKTDFVCWEFLF